MRGQRRQRLLAAFPDIPVISEEDASEFGTPDAIGPRFFLVDPLDGTKAFVRGDPNFTVNIGLVQDRRPVAGAVYAPVTEELWWTTPEGVLRTIKGGAPEPVKVRAWPEGEAVDDRRTAEVWTFQRNLKSRDPNWTLIHVDAAEA